MAEEKIDTSGFKVVDRRTFSEDGTRRSTPPEHEETRSSHPAAPTADQEGEPEQGFDEGPTGFEALVSYLSTTAMFQLGMLAGPSGERIPPDIVNARRTIDLLEVLGQKTRGNLTSDEARLLEDILYELRTGFVEVQKQLSKPKK